MSIRTIFRLSDEEGSPDEVRARKRRILDDQLRPARLEIARRNARWEEIEEVDLVPRGRRGSLLVSAKTDRIYQQNREAGDDRDAPVAAQAAARRLRRHPPRRVRAHDR